MEPSSWAKLIMSVFKSIGFFKKKSEIRYPIYKIYKKLNIAASEVNFDSIFNQALYDFETSVKTHPKIIELFKMPSAKDAFRREYYNKGDGYFYTDLNTNLNLQSQFDELKGMSINLEVEIKEFLRIFDDKVNQSRSPKEVETAEDIKVLNEKIDKLFINSKNIHIPEQLREISKLREANNHNAVLTLLNNLKEKNWSDLTPELRYSVLLHLAATYIDLSDKKMAAAYFIELPTLNVKPGEAHGYASLGYALVGETEKSIDHAEKALRANPEDLNAYLGLFFSKEETMEVDDIDSLIPKNLQEKPQIALNIGTFLEKKHEYEKAFAVFEKLNSTYTEWDSFKCDIVVQLGANRMHAIDNKEDYLFNQLDEESMEKVSYAHECFEKAWNYLKNTDLRFSRWYVLTNKGVSCKILDKKDQAEKDFLDSLALKKTYFTYRHLLILKMDAGENTDELISEIEKLDLEEEETQELAVFKSDKLFNERRSREALDIILTIFPKIGRTDLKKQVGSMIIGTYLRMSNYGEAERYGLQLAQDFSEDPFSFYNLSKIYYQKGEDDKGLEYLNKSKSLITEKTPRFIANYIIDKLINQNELISASEALELIANTNINSQLTKKLIVIYYRSGNHKKAMRTVEHLLKHNPDDPFLVDIASSIYETIENYDQAISLVSDYLVRHPSDKFMLVKLSMNCYKKEDYARGCQELDKIKDYADIPLHIQFLIAHLYIKNKEYEKGLAIAYTLRGNNYSDPTVHNRYIQCITGMDLKNEIYFPEMVRKDSYIVLKDSAGKVHSYVLVDTPKAQNEIAIDEHLGRSLIGKRIADTILWNDEILQIESILWKYTYALHDSMDQLYLRFGNTQPIKVFKLREGESPAEQLPDIFKMIDSAHDFDKKVEQLYLQGKTTIGVNTRLSGLSAIKYWSTLVSSPDIGVVSVGTTLEFQIGIRQLALNKPLILDITALLTLFHTKAFDFLEKVKNKKIITRSTLEVIENEISDIKSSLASDTVVVNKVGAQYFRHIVTKEEKERQLTSLSELLNKVNTICEVATPQLSENYTEKEKADRLFGQSFNESLLVVQELDGILFSDDSFFRSLAFNERRINGISTLIYTMFLEQQQLIHGIDTEDVLENLIKLNYRNIPSNPKLLFKILSGCDYKIQQPFINACDFIDPLFISDIQATRIVVDFLVEVYLSASITFTKSFVTQYILSKLFMNRNSIIIKRYLIGLIDTKFRLLPLQRDEVISIIRSFG